MTDDSAMNAARRNREAFEIVIVCLSPIAIAALAASLLWNVEAMAAGAPWKLLGLHPAPCPGCAACGLSRAFSAVSHGRLHEALAFNAGVVAVYPAAWTIAVAGIWFAARYLLQRSSPCRPLPS
jgi:hypothetical protein